MRTMFVLLPLLFALAFGDDEDSLVVSSSGGGRRKREIPAAPYVNGFAPGFVHGGQYSGFGGFPVGKFGPFAGGKFGPFAGGKFGPFAGGKVGPFAGGEFGPFAGNKFGAFLGPQFAGFPNENFGGFGKFSGGKFPGLSPFSFGKFAGGYPIQPHGQFPIKGGQFPIAHGGFPGPKFAGGIHGFQHPGFFPGNKIGGFPGAFPLGKFGQGFFPVQKAPFLGFQQSAPKLSPFHSVNPGLQRAQLHCPRVGGTISTTVNECSCFQYMATGCNTTISAQPVCTCPVDKVTNHQGHCLAVEKCLQCDPATEVQASCGRVCSCADFRRSETKQCLTSCAQSRNLCYCKPGFVRSNHGGKCIPEEVCVAFRSKKRSRPSY